MGCIVPLVQSVCCLLAAVGLMGQSEKPVAILAIIV